MERGIAGAYTSSSLSPKTPVKSEQDDNILFGSSDTPLHAPLPPSSASSADMRSLAQLFSPVKSAVRLSSETKSKKRRRNIHIGGSAGAAGGDSDSDLPPTLLKTKAERSKSAKKKICLRPSTYTPPPRKAALPIATRSSLKSSSYTSNRGNNTMTMATDETTTELTPTWRINMGLRSSSSSITTTTYPRKCADCSVGVTPTILGKECDKCKRLCQIANTAMGRGGEGGGKGEDGRLATKVTPAPAVIHQPPQSQAATQRARARAESESESSVSIMGRPGSVARAVSAPTFSTATAAATTTSVDSALLSAAAALVDSAMKAPPTPTRSSPRRNVVKSYIPPNTPIGSVQTPSISSSYQTRTSPRLNNGGGISSVPFTPNTPRTPGMDELAADFVWNQNEIDTAQQWQDELNNGSLKSSSIMSPGGLLKWDTGATATTNEASGKKSTGVTFALHEEDNEADMKAISVSSSMKVAGKTGKSLHLLAAKKKPPPPSMQTNEKDDYDDDIDEDDEYDEAGTREANDDDDEYKPKSSSRKKRKKTTKKKKPNAKKAKSASATAKSSSMSAVKSGSFRKTKAFPGPKKGKGSSSSSSNNKGEKFFSLHAKGDEEHINQVHILVRRDIWEGFVVGTTSTTASSTPGSKKGDDKEGSRSEARLSRYANTVGFRCKWCKHARPSDRAEKSAVYPRSITRIYLSNIRFQRDHIV